MIAQLASAPMVDNCLTRNEWICGEYVRTRLPELSQALVQHVSIVIASVTLGLIIAFPLAWWSRRYPRIDAFLLGTSTAIYSIPSLALFSLLVPLIGLNVYSVIVGLGLYSLTVLVRAIGDGLGSVSPAVLESALGVGYSPAALLFRVQLPLALPTIMAGLRVAMVSAVALTTVGAILDAGGLGGMLLDGQRTNFKAQVLVTSVLCVVLAVLLDLFLVLIQRLITPWRRGLG
ncbi:MAG TPA: ABC transporter permease subunit [Marmoricola sp.]|nr:ABC transporter permease subunit [Marmoricola sp.]